jgi:hypothetical protein
VFKVNNPRLCLTATLRPYVPVTTHEDNDDEYDLYRILADKVDTLARRRRKYMLFYTRFKDEDFSLVWHRLTELQRITALQVFLDSHDWLEFASFQEDMYFMRTTRQTRLPHSQ